MLGSALKLLYKVLAFSFVITSFVKAEGLVDSVNLAFQNNYEYKAAIERYNNNNTFNNIAVTYLLPRVDLSASALANQNARTYKDVANKDFDYNSNTYGFDVMLSQPLYNMQAWAYYSKAKLQSEYGSILLDQDKNSIILKVAEYYFSVLEAKDNVEFIAIQKISIQKQLNEMQRKIEVGEASKIDIEEIRAAYEKVLSDEITYKNNLDVKTSILNEFLNKEITEHKKVKDSIEGIYTDNSTLEDWLNLTSKGNLDILASNISILLAEKDIDANNATYYPNISLVGRYSNNNGEDRGIDKYNDENRYIGLSLNMNLFAGGTTYQTNKQLKYRKNEISFQKKALENNIKSLTKQYYLNVYNGLSQLSSLQQALISSGKSLEAAEKSYQVGLKTITDVLDNNQKYFDAKRNLARAKYGFLLSILSLKAISGVISEGDIIKLEAYLE